MAHKSIGKHTVTGCHLQPNTFNSVLTRTLSLLCIEKKKKKEIIEGLRREAFVSRDIILQSTMSHKICVFNTAKATHQL